VRESQRVRYPLLKVPDLVFLFNLYFQFSKCAQKCQWLKQLDVSFNMLTSTTGLGALAKLQVHNSKLKLD
jgi:hypothetical protein